MRLHTFPRSAYAGFCHIPTTTETSHEDRRSEGNQEPRVPRRPDARERARVRRARPFGDGAGGRRRGDRPRRRAVPRGRRHAGRQRAGGVRQGRHDRQGQGAAAAGVRDAAPRPAALHLPAPGAGSRADGRAGEVGRGLRGLRDHHRRQRRPAAARADERGGGAHVHPGRRRASREEQGRHGRAAGRRAGRGAGPRGDPRRGRRGHARAAVRGGRGRARDGAGQERRPPAPARPGVRQPHHDAVLERAVGGGVGARGRPRHRRRADPRRGRAQARHARHDLAHEEGRGRRRRGDRPGRLLRDLARHHARRAHLRGRRRRALLRGQHARRGRAHVHVRAQQRHDRPGPRAGRPGLAGGDARQSAPEGGAQRGAAARSRSRPSRRRWATPSRRPTRCCD